MNKRIDLTAIDTQITPIIHAVQYDTDRYIDCYFEDVDVSTVSAARIYGLKPDGTEVYNDCVINDGYIIAPLTSQTLAVVGKVNCQLQLVIDGTLTSFAFTVIVDESLVSSSAIPSSNEYTALEAALAEVENVIEGLPAKEDKANKVTELSADSTDREYPSAKCVYDLLVLLQNYIDTELAKKLNLAGGIMTGVLNMGGKGINNVATPYGNNSAANKKYVDNSIAAALIVDTEEVIP